MSREDLDLEQLDQLAREFWQDDLAKFFPKQKEPTYTEYKMFQAGFQKALELQEVEKDEKMFLNEHDENVRLHFENVDLKEQNTRLREALEFTISAAEYLYNTESPVPRGLAPMFYHSLSYEGDVELVEKTKKARAALEGGK